MEKFFCKDRGCGISGWPGRVWAVVLLFGFTSLGMAQLDTGTISGTVTDQTGGAVPGAAITIRNVQTGITRSMESNATGRYDAAALPVGTYEVRAALPGFQTLVRSGITLTVGRNAVVDMGLQVGEVAQSVTVTGEAGFVETTTATVTNLVTERQVTEIPLNNRDLTQLAFLQPGVLRVPGGGGNPNSSARFGLGQKLTVNGARASMNVYLTDGVSNSDISGNTQSAAGNYAGAETIKEFQVITNNYSAEYQSKAGAIVSAVTKSGTNAFHGSLFEFMRNDNLDAHKWEDNAFGNVKPEFKRNQFGGSVGGPILRDKAFFFTSYEALRERAAKTSTAIVPSLAARAGAIVPVNPVVRPYLDLWPVPLASQDLGGGRALVSGSAASPANDDFGTGKLDYQFASPRKGFLAVTYSIDDSDSTDVSFIPTDATALGITTRKHVISARHTSILSASALNEFTFGYTNANIVSAISQSAGAVDWANFNGVDLRFRPDVPVMGRLIAGDGIVQVGARSRPNAYGLKTFAFRESLTLTRQRHTIKLGAEIQRVQNPLEIEGDSTVGDYDVGGIVQFLQGTPLLFETGLAPGTPIHGGRLKAIAVPTFDFRQSQFGFYVQDNFSVLPSLTLNLGLRYEFQTTPVEKDNHAGSLRNIFDDLLTIGAPFSNPTKKNFSPRVGFAWAPAGQKTSIRGGVAIYYDPPKIIDWAKNFTTQSPFNPESLAQGTASAPLQFPNVFTLQPGLLAGSPIMRYVEYDQRPVTFYRWSLTMEREIGPWLISAGYTGSRATHLWVEYEANTNKWDGWPNDVPSDQKRFRAANGLINPAWSRITVESPAGNSFYQGLTFNATKRLSHGLQMQFAYSLSKAIDQGSGLGNAERFPQSQGSAYYWDKAMARGRASFDIRNNSATNLTYELPKTSLTGIAGAITNGWQMSGILSLADGVAFSLLDGGNSRQRSAMLGRTVEQLRPNLIPGGNNDPVLGSPNLYYDPTQVIPSTCRGTDYCYNTRNNPKFDSNIAVNAARPDLGYVEGYFGNLGKNTVTGPGLATLDFSLNKNFQLTEEKRLQFRSEFFNLLNRPNFALPDFDPFLSNGTTDPQAGKIVATNTTARQIQFALKFIF